MAKTVLIVGENAPGRRLIAGLRRSAGHETVAAGSGAGAPAAAWAAPAGRGRMAIDIHRASGPHAAPSPRLDETVAPRPPITVISRATRGGTAHAVARGCAGHGAKSAEPHGFLDAEREFAQDRGGD